MITKPFQKKYSSVAVYCDTQTLCLLQLKQAKSGYHLHNIYCATLSTIKNHSVQPKHTSQILLDAMHTGLAKMQLKHSNASLVIEEDFVTTKLITVPMGKSYTDREAHILYEAQKALLFPIQEVYFDYVILKDRSKKNQTVLPILFIAVSRQHLDWRIKLMKQVGFRIQYVELQSYATLRLGQLYAALSCLDCSEKTIALIDIHHTSIKISVLRKYVIIFVSALSLQTNQKLKLDVSNPDRDLSHHATATSVDAWCDEMLINCKRIFNMYTTSDCYSLPDIIVLMGNTKLFLDKLACHIYERLQIACISLDLFSTICASREKCKFYLQSNRSEVIACCGLAIRSLSKDKRSRLAC